MKLYNPDTDSVDKYTTKNFQVCSWNLRDTEQAFNSDLMNAYKADDIELILKGFSPS
jgi:hypothetical protein